MDIDTNQEKSVDVLFDAIQLYNDLKFRQQVNNKDEQIKAFSKQIDSINDSDKKEQKKKEFEKLKEERKAFAANIFNEILKPKTLNATNKK